MYYEFLLQEHVIWDTNLLIGILCIALLYILLLHRLRTIKMHQKQVILFLLGLGLLYITIGSPLSRISHFSFSLHMIQMSILYFIIPPIILLGIPNPMLDHILHRLKINQKCFDDKIPLFIFAVLFFIYHLPFILNLLSQHSFFQNGYLFLLFILSFGMWWPIASPDPNRRLHQEHMKRYAFLSGLILMPACMLFILTALLDGGNNPFLNQITAQLCIPNQSTSVSILPPPFNTKADQMMAGIVMLGLHKFGLVMTFKIENKVQ